VDRCRSTRRSRKHSLCDRVIAAPRLLPEETEFALDRAAAIVTARMADVCGIYLRRDTRFDRVVWRGRAGIDLASVEPFPDEPDREHPLRRAAVSGRTILLAATSSAGPRTSAMFAPLSVGKHTLGVLVLLRIEPSEPYREGDRAYAEAVAELTALAIDYRALITEREQFIADVAHELKTPLTSILLTAQFARRGASSNIERYAERIEHAARALRSVTDSMLERFVAMRIDRERDETARSVITTVGAPSNPSR
jgi:signal transduction histidine kinase